MSDMDNDMDVHVIDVPFDVEMILRDREESRRIRMVVNVPSNIANIEELMAHAIHHILIDLDTVGQNRMILVDELGNTHITLISEIQSISIGAPTELPEGLHE